LAGVPGLRAVICEDEALIRMTLKLMLTEMGCDVVGETAYGEEAVSLVETHRPDVVFLDIRLKDDVDGVEAALRINTLCNAAIVFMSAYDYDERIRATGLQRIAAIVSKPFLQSRIDAALASVTDLLGRPPMSG